MTSAVWNRYHESLLKRWSQMSKTYSVMHSLCAQYYSKWHKILGVPVVIVGGVTASSIFSSNNQGGDAGTWTIINGALALFMTALAGVNNFLGTAEKTNKHQIASYKYTKIAMDIDTLLSFERTDRSSTPQEFIQARKADMLQIRENAPEVLPWIMERYLKRLDKSLIDTTSRINRQGSMCADMDQSSAENSEHLIATPPRVDVFDDFQDKVSSAIVQASRKIKQLHRDEHDSDSDTGAGTDTIAAQHRRLSSASFPTAVAAPPMSNVIVES